MLRVTGFFLLSFYFLNEKSINYKKCGKGKCEKITFSLLMLESVCYEGYIFMQICVIIL